MKSQKINRCNGKVPSNESVILYLQLGLENSGLHNTKKRPIVYILVTIEKKNNNDYIGVLVQRMDASTRLDHASSSKVVPEFHLYYIGLVSRAKERKGERECCEREKEREREREKGKRNGGKTKKQERKRKNKEKKQDT